MTVRSFEGLSAAWLRAGAPAIAPASAGSATCPNPALIVPAVFRLQVHPASWSARDRPATP